jgi:hypothetical protein
MNKNHKRVMSGVQLCWKAEDWGACRVCDLLHSSPDPVEIVDARCSARLSKNHFYD